MLELKNWAVIAVDVQNDFCPGGSLAVTDGDQVVEPLNEVYKLAQSKNQLTIATRDFHPEVTNHFAKYGGIWPEHCVQGTDGAKFHPRLLIDSSAIFSKAMKKDEDAFSGFQGFLWSHWRPMPDAAVKIDLHAFLRSYGVKKLYVGGLATDYCDKATVLDALKLGYDVTVLTDAIRAVNIKPNDGAEALGEMVQDGAKLMTTEEFLKAA